MLIRKRAAPGMCENIRPGYVAEPDNWQPYKVAQDEKHLFRGLRKAALRKAGLRREAAKTVGNPTHRLDTRP